MPIRISPALKGLITAVLMIAAFLVVFKTNKESGGLQYIVYGFYGLGITWTLMAYRRSASFTGKFADLFSQGFRCFIVVTLSIALFYWIFNAMHPEFAEESAVSFKERLKLSKDIMPPDIESEVATFKKQYTLKLVSGAIFGYLIIGVGVTGAGAALLSRRK